MNPHLLDIPTCLDTPRLYLRCYQPADAPTYYAVSQRNRAHLARYDAGNALMTIATEADAEAVLRQLAAAWTTGTALFLGAFDRRTDAFVAQIYIGVVSWELPEFELGYIVDKDHQGRGYVTEAAQAALRFMFEQLGAYRVRLECDATNRRSFRVAERCGMVREAQSPAAAEHAGAQSRETLHCRLLRSEFEAIA